MASTTSYGAAHAVSARRARAAPTRTTVAYACLNQTRYSWVWVVVACPYCGTQHEHYAGPRDAAPRCYAEEPVAALCDQAVHHQPRRPSHRLQYVLEINTPIPDRAAGERSRAATPIPEC